MHVYMEIPFVDATLKLFEKIYKEINYTKTSIEYLYNTLPNNKKSVDRKSRYVYYYLMKEFYLKLTYILNVKFCPHFMTIAADSKSVFNNISNEKLLYQIDTPHYKVECQFKSSPHIYTVEIDNMCKYHFNAKIDREMYSAVNKCINPTTNYEARLTIEDTIQKLKSLLKYTISIKNGTMKLLSKE